MLLTVDIGNTTVALGFYNKNDLVFTHKLLSKKDADKDEYCCLLKDIFTPQKAIDNCIISSVVPEITDKIVFAIKELTGVEPIFAGAENYGGLKVDILPISEIGADLIAVCVGTVSKYPLPCLVADLGTATKILVLDQNGKFLGCTIAPGVKISLDALFKGASLLDETTFRKPLHCVGTNTEECIQSGIVFGTACMLDGMFQRITEETGFENPTLIVTGGYGKIIADCLKEEIILDENLLSDGLKVIFEKSQTD